MNIPNSGTTEANKDPEPIANIPTANKNVRLVTLLWLAKTLSSSLCEGSQEVLAFATISPAFYDVYTKPDFMVPMLVQFVLTS